MKTILNTYTVTELKKFISQNNIKGYSKLKKDELIKLMTKAEHINKFKHIKPKEKKEKPAPKKKEEAPKKKVEPKKEVKTKYQIHISRNALDIINTYIKLRESFRKSNVKFPKFVCKEWVSEYIYNYILEKNSSDCSFDVLHYSDKKSLEIGNLYKKAKDRMLLDKIITNAKLYNLKINIEDGDYGGYDPLFLHYEGFDKVYLKYRECKNKGLILCIPFSIGRTDRHRNMLIINHYTNSFERYEPHGSRTRSTKLLKSSEYDKMLKKMMNYFNKRYNEKFEYLSPDKTCPKRPDIKENIGFQSLEYKEAPIGEDLYKGIMYKEVSGYCCMWSFFIMDLRLKRPKENPQKLFTNAYSLLRRGDKPFRTFIRAFTNEIMNDMNREFNQTYEFIVRRQAKERKGGILIQENELNTEMKKKIRKFIDDKQIQYSKNLKK